MLLIQNGTIVTGRNSFRGDVFIEGEKIKKVIPAESAERERLLLSEITEKPLIIDAENKLIFPGFIDAHTHFDLHVAGTVTCDDFASGTMAALSGGTTTIIDFGTQYAGESLEEGFQNWLKKASVGCSCDFGIHMSITDWNSQARQDCQKMMEEGLTTFKIYLTYDIKVSDQDLYGILRRMKEIGGIIGCHCEYDGMIKALQEEAIQNGKLKNIISHPKTRPAAAEAEAINRYLHMAEVVNEPVIVVHLTCKEGLEEIRAARRRGQIVYAETCPQYLLLTKKCYQQPGFTGAKYVIAPPLRDKSDCDALWKALSEGEIQTISTDHCAFTLKQKELGKEDFRKIPGGMPGVENRGELIFSEGVATGKITKEQMCLFLSENPAKLYGLWGKKGAIKEGFDADIVIIDPQKEKTITVCNQVSRCDYAPFEGMKIRGSIEKTFLRGVLAAENGKVLVKNRGRYLKRHQYIPL